MGEAVEVLASETDALQEGHDALGELLARCLVVDAQRPSDDVLDEMPRVQRAERVLEDDLAVAAIGPPRLSCQLVDAVLGADALDLPLLLVAPPCLRYRLDLVEASDILVREAEVDLA